jgi:hypothetical protein
MSAIAARVEALLQGEPLRFIVYGSAIVVWIVVGLANALGLTRLGPPLSLDSALVYATGAAAFLTEMCRRFVRPVASLPSAPPAAPTPVPPGSE